MTDPTEHQTEAAKARALVQPTCPHCGAPLDRHQAISPGHCGSPTCMARHLTAASDARDVARAEETQQRRDTARRRAAAPLQRAAKALGAQDADLTVAVVPFQNAPVVPLPDTRRAAFAAHIDEILTRAFNDTDSVILTGPASDPSPEPPIINAACAACQGLCCRRGGGTAHAFLTSQTVVHLMQSAPDLTADALRQTYLNALPATSVMDACVYQSANGCTLPRTLRASLCNSFHCHDIFALHDQTEGRSDRPVALVAMDDDDPAKVVAFDDRIGGIVLSETLDP